MDKEPLLKKVTGLLGDIDPLDDESVKKFLKNINDIVDKAPCDECKDTLNAFIIMSVTKEYIVPVRELLEKLKKNG